MDGGSSTSTFLQRNTQPTVLQFLERLRASQTQFNLLGQGRGLGTCLGRTAAKCGSFPRFCSSTRFLSAWKIWQDKTLVGHQGLLRPCRDWYSDNKHLFARTCKYHFCKDRDTQNILDFKQLSPYRALFGLFDLKSIGLRAAGTRARWVTWENIPRGGERCSGAKLGSNRAKHGFEDEFFIRVFINNHLTFFGREDEVDF